VRYATTEPALSRRFIEKDDVRLMRNVGREPLTFGLTGKMAVPKSSCVLYERRKAG